MTFTTGASAPSAVTEGVSGVTPTSATLHGTVNANNESTTVTFEYGLDTGYGTTLAAQPGTVSGLAPTAVSAPVAGLVPSTTYHYRVVAQSAGGTTYGADRTFYTGDPAGATATTMLATDVSLSAARLNGLVNANGNSTTVTFEYGLDTTYGRQVTAIQSPVEGTDETAVSARLTNLLGHTTYHYRVVAQNGYGTAYGADMVFTTTLVRYLPLVRRGAVLGPDLVVQQIQVVDHDVLVVLANAGGAPAVDDFWVDLYVNPSTPPTGVNQTWQTQGCAQGIAWGVTQDLAPGEALTLTLSSPYLDASHTVFDGVTAGDVLYVQADSAAVGSSYGTVLETHEVTGGVYNNISHSVVTADGDAAALPADGSPASRGELSRRP
jgi:hypothetical protein